MFKNNKVYLLIWLVIVFAFFARVIGGVIPAPLDTIVGLYHPFRDKIWDGYKQGVPFKNFLITDPVRQQIPYRYLAIEKIKKGELTSWNSYSFSGVPLSANIQSASYYPLNFIFLLFPFIWGWTIYIVLGPLLSGIFFYLYLNNFKLGKISSIFGALTFSFSGFFVAWMEWGTITHVILWLPLILLSYEKLIEKTSIKWVVILFFSQLSSLLAGHLQVSFYVFMFTSIYLIIKLRELDRRRIILKKLTIFLFVFTLVSIVSLIQYYPLYKLINSSSRNYDLPDWQTASWFLPWQNLIQFIAPDFFGNPSTLNYWGEWNYAEFIGYISIAPMIFAISAIFTRGKSKLDYLKWILLFLFLLILPTPIAKIPYILKIPFLETSQPTRLLSIIVFIFSIFAAFGLNKFLKNEDKNNKNIFRISVVILIIIISLACFIFFSRSLFSAEIVDKLKSISLRNLVFPFILAILIMSILTIKNKISYRLTAIFLMLISVIDLYRFSNKFLSFSNTSWFYPPTEIIQFLTNQKDVFRIMAVDRRILAPNFSIMYKLEDVSGYDPLYLVDYAKLYQAWETNGKEYYPGRYNRIINPTNYESFITDLLNVKYVLALTNIDSPKLRLILKEGETRLYENINIFPRVYFVEYVISAESEKEVVDLMFSEKENLRKTAIISEKIHEVEKGPLEIEETIEITDRSENYLKLNTHTNKNRLLVLSEIYYPSWQVYIDGVLSKIYKVNLAFRAVAVPKGSHRVEFKYQEFFSL